MEQTNPLRPDGESKGGVLAHLERLETQMSKSCKQSEEPQSVQAQEGALGTKIHKLRRLRDELRAAVRHRQASVKASIANVEPTLAVEMSEQEVLEEKLENVKAVLQAYRFTGLSGKLTSRGVCVCISTAFEGTLLDSYFVDLVIQKPLQIHHHSVPVFIPLEEIAAKYLQTNIQHFLFSLCEYLNAYSGRKYQADRLQSDFAALLTGPLQRNPLCNLLSFTYKLDPGGQSFPFCARLLYKDLTATLPTDVTVTYQGVEPLSTSWEEQRASHETLFCTKPLHQVFASFARKGEKLDMSLVS
ncbi:centromere protein O [Aotus nancymaae]|uniref:centromere protein O n=1 Tax=Aotus nancymaae TaxID=37293 RepID=UPI0030FE4EBC